MDPDSIRGSRKMEKLEAMRRSSGNTRTLPVCDFVDDEDDETVELEENREQNSSEDIPQVLLMTSVVTADKKDLKTKISQLGGTVVEATSERVTCCIAGSLMRNEKILVSLASGIPILPMDYIHESAEQGKWLGKRTYKLNIDSFLTEKTRNEALFYISYNFGRFITNFFRYS